MDEIGAVRPPLAPMRFGSYDFARNMYFQGIGASGFAMGSIKTWLRHSAAGLPCVMPR